MRVALRCLPTAALLVLLLHAGTGCASSGTSPEVEAVEEYVDALVIALRAESMAPMAQIATPEQVERVRLYASQFVAQGQVVDATVGAAAKTLTDAGNGKLSGNAGAGLIDYASGYYRLIFTTAPDDDTAITADYSHDAAGAAVAAAVLLEAIDASLADEAGNVLAHGVVTADDLIWPANITAAQKTRALAQLAQAGIRAL